MDSTSVFDRGTKIVLKFIVIYIVLASIWVLFSDSILIQFVSDMETYSRLQTYKGWAFILFTGALFLVYLKPRIKALDESQKALVETERELKRRLDYELATVDCMRILLETNDVDDVIPNILETIHRTVDSSRSYIFRNEDDPYLGICMSQTHEVVADGVSREIDNPLLKHLPYSEGSPTLLATLQAKKAYAHIVAELDEPERTILSEQGILSVLIIPIYTGQELWGFIGFDDCEQARQWHEDDINLLRIVADGIGEAILRQRARDNLKESEERFKRLHNASFGGIAIHDKGIILDCNQGLSEISGYTMDELVGMDGLLLIAENSRDIVMHNILSGFEEAYKVTGLRKDGKEYPLQLEAKNIPYRGKEVRVVEFRDITERRRTEEALKQASDRLALATKAGGVGIWDYDIVNNTLVWDEQMFCLYGITQEQFGGAYDAWKSGLHPDDLERSDLEIQMALSGEKEFDTEFRVLWPDGTVRNIRALAVIQRDESGKPLRMIGTNWDITDQKRAEEELQESEIKYRSLFNQSAEGIYLHDLKGSILDVNEEAVVQSGYTREELLDMNVLSFLPEEFDKEDILQQWSQWSPGKPLTLEAQHFHKNGTIYPIELTTSCVYFGNEKLILTMVRDISKRKEAEKALRESEAKLSAMIANISDVIAIIDENGINRYKSPNIEKWFGWKPEEVVGISTWQNIHPEDMKKAQEVVRNLTEETDIEITAETRYLCKDGTYKWIEFTARNLLHEPSIKGILLNYHDISDRKKADNALREGERKFRSYIENAPHGIFIVDETGNCMEVNRTASILTGYSEKELVGAKLTEMIEPEFLHRSKKIFRELKENGFSSSEVIFRKKNGTKRWLKCDATRLAENSNLVFASDITEKKKAEHSLIEAKMMAEENSRIKSEFLANMSHELRTPLTAIIGFSDMLNTKMAGDLNEKQFRFIDHINKSGEHLLELINDILDLSKVEAGKMKLECEYFSVSAMFEEIRTLMTPMAMRKNVDLKIENNITTDDIFADRVKFKQIMYNLLSNAIKFTPENGEVFVAAERIDKKVSVSVTDSGIGIPEHRLSDIFDPFTQVDSSNKRKHGGTGLGLTLVKQFVEMHEGEINVESEEGTGSTFTFTIADTTCEEKVSMDSEIL